MEPLPSQPPSPTSEPLSQEPITDTPAHPIGQVINPSVTPSVSEQPSPPIPEVAEITPPLTANNPAAVGEGISGPETYTVSPAMGTNDTEIFSLDAGAKKKKRFIKAPLIIAGLAVFVLLASSAGAYFGYYVPNKPENVLAKAVSNSLAESQITTTGSIDSSSNGIAGRVDYTVAVNEASHAVDLKLNASISGVKIPIEVVVINKNLYFKVGDLSSLQGLLSQLAGANNAEVKNLADQINKTITNQWIEVDSTLIKEAKLDCLASFPASFSQSDIQALQNAYKSNPFIAISSHSSEKVNGAKATKYQLSVDDNTLSTFDLNSSGYFKQLNSCLKKTSPGSNLNLKSLKDGDKTPVTIWVDNATKRIIKYSVVSTAKDKSKGVDGSVSGIVNYGQVNISQPANAKPVLNLLNEIQLPSTFSGL
ncbi:hypothetical protein KW803_02045 [Candidatus Saccharibacteria bacterium]|nr:hypothetical protein [Candidatus Saccharibacteria bacterium]